MSKHLEVIAFERNFHSDAGQQACNISTENFLISDIDCFKLTCPTLFYRFYVNGSTRSNIRSSEISCKHLETSVDLKIQHDEKKHKKSLVQTRVDYLGIK